MDVDMDIAQVPTVNISEQVESISNAPEKGILPPISYVDILTPWIVIFNPQNMIAIAQSEFNITAYPTCRGHVWKTCNMAEITACTCGKPVSEEEKSQVPYNVDIEGVKHLGYVPSI